LVISELNLIDSCQHFGDVIIPTKVYEETVMNGKKKGHPDALIIEQTINDNLITIKEIENNDKVDNLRLFWVTSR